MSAGYAPGVHAALLLYDTADLARRTSAYPLEEINDYLRPNPEREQMVQGTLSYFDLRWFAPRVNSTTLLMAGADGAALDAALDPLVQSMPGETEVHKAEHSGYKLDFVQKLDTWRNRRTSCCGWPTEILHCRG